jgi:hypothetical protein
MVNIVAALSLHNLPFEAVSLMAAGAFKALSAASGQQAILIGRSITHVFPSRCNMKALALSTVLVALFSTLTLFASPTKDKADEIYVKVYNVADLPVWRTNLKQTEFAPEVLIKYLQTSVDPKSWSARGEIKGDAKTWALVVSQTQANHEAIADALRSFRPHDGREVEEVRPVSGGQHNKFVQ